MLNIIWGAMIVLGIVYAAFTGKMPDVSSAALTSAKEAVTLCITMVGVMSLWTGIMEIADSVGIMRQMTRLLKPAIKFLFPRIPEGHSANTHITTNIIANILGLGWAATPAGLRAMKSLSELNSNNHLHHCRYNFCQSNGKEKQVIMKFIVYISDYIIPFVIFYVVGLGLLSKKNIYDDFIRGAKEGFKTVIGIMPTLIGLMVAVGILRASGFLDFLSEKLGYFTEIISLPSQLVPIIIVKMFSSSASTGLVLDIFKEFGPDSLIGTMTSIMMSCTETIFYTMSVYFITAKVTKTRYTLVGALVATFSGVIASIIITNLMF